MSQLSWMSSQIQNLTPREIFGELRERDPRIWPSHDEYVSYVKAIVLSRMQANEDQLSVVQCADLLKSVRSFVSNNEFRNDSVFFTVLCVT